MIAVLRRNPWAMTGARAVASLACAIVLFVALPRVVGTHWGEVGQVLSRLTLVDVVLLSGIWLAGLLCYTVVQAAALPGLGHGRALTLNLAGSMVANAVPLGGIVSISVNLAMIRSWALTTASFVRFTTLTHLLNILTKLAIAAAALSAVWFAGVVPGRVITWSAIASVAAFAASAALVAMLLGGDRGARALGAAVQPLLRWGWRAARRHAEAPDARAGAIELRRRIADLVRAGWGRMTFGLMSYSAAQFLLFALSLHVVGCRGPLLALFGAFAVERAFTLVPITPGGVGIAETMSTLMLVALAVDPVTGAAGVVVYRAFAFFFELPIGFIALLGWWAHRARRRRQLIAA
ncbi:MAG: flippase-like domain-containing protein [Frankiaceae bacterium]|jgi:uncharacterized membrane protein YbhN (UPF0104 family)|nr:flippase-like domain-containing protein [Frankiaceae bacterium]